MRIRSSDWERRRLRHRHHGQCARDSLVTARADARVSWQNLGYSRRAGKKRPNQLVNCVGERIGIGLEAARAVFGQVVDGHTVAVEVAACPGFERGHKIRVAGAKTHALSKRRLGYDLAPIRFHGTHRHTRGSLDCNPPRQIDPPIYKTRG